MGWRFTDDVEAYAEAVWGLLARDPIDHTVALSVIESVRTGHRSSEHGEARFGCYDDGEVRGAVLLTPPYELLLTVVPAGTVGELVTALRREDTRFPGIHGDTESAERFVAAWTSATGLRAVLVREMRLYHLTTLRPPAPAPPGRARPAGRDDLETAVRWRREFEAEPGVPPTDVESAMRRAINDGRVWLWEDDMRAPVAFASRTPVVVGVARIAPVYTPPAYRRHGYGAAVTAACTQDALARGAEHAVLFTDLANRTSNSIYQQIGYAPVRDYHLVRFAGGAE
jgi:predicted GNAT family acetyltransferase